jgi:ATP-dependent DNA helicase DinG
MAEQVAQVLAEGGTLICEAGTGTGKTYAYLTPALLSGRKVLISTGTRNLQDQLYPPRPAPGARCPRPPGAHRSAQRAGVITSAPIAWSWPSQDHRGGLARIPPPAPGRARLGQRHAERRHRRTAPPRRCPRLAGRDLHQRQLPAPGMSRTGIAAPCSRPAAAPRRRTWWWSITTCYARTSPCATRAFGEILPGADAFIVDEAHQFPEVAGNFFGSAVSSRQLLELVRDAEMEYTREAGDLPEFPEHPGQAASSPPSTCAFALGEEARRWSLAGDHRREPRPPRAWTGGLRQASGGGSGGAGDHGGPRQGARLLSGPCQLTWPRA